MTQSDPRHQTSSVRTELALERFLPSDSTGYIRPLRPDESEQPYFIPDGYGFFDANGDARGAAVDQRKLVRTAWEKGYQTYTVH